MTAQERELLISAFFDYKYTEGCECCQDVEGHKIAEDNLARILKPDVYSDESGYNWGSNPAYESKPYPKDKQWKRN